MEIFFEPITIQRLEDYCDKVRELDCLLDKKQKLLSKINSLKGVDYSQAKVTQSNRKKTTEEEYFSMALEKVNREIDFLKYKCFGVYGLVEEHKVIKTQIARIKKWNYRKILVYRYLEKWKWAEIVQDFFEFEEDYETEKNDKYRDTIMYWHRQALKELGKVSKKPYKPIVNQLTLQLEKGK